MFYKVIRKIFGYFYVTVYLRSGNEFSVWTKDFGVKTIPDNPYNLRVKSYSFDGYLSAPLYVDPGQIEAIVVRG